MEYYQEKRHSIMVKGYFIKKTRILNVYISCNNRNFKYMKQNLTGIRKEIHTITIIFGNFNIPSQ